MKKGLLFIQSGTLLAALLLFSLSAQAGINWARNLSIGATVSGTAASGQIVVGTGAGTAAWVTMSGSCTLASTGVITCTAPALNCSTFSGDVSGTSGCIITVASATSAFALLGDISPSQITSDQNNYNPTSLSTSSVIRLNGDSSFRTITGLAGGADGRIITLINISLNSILLSDQTSLGAASSTASNRFDFDGYDFVLFPSQSLQLIYDATSSLWRSNGDTRFLLPSKFGFYARFEGRATSESVWGFATANSGSNVSPAAEAGHPYMIRPTTGANTNGGAGVITGVLTPFLFGGSMYYSYRSVLRMNQLSTAAELFTMRAGFMDISTVGDAVDGCYFRYTNGTNGGRWQGVCRAASTESTCDSGSTPSASVWYSLGIKINPAGTSADFSVNDVYGCSVTTNLPVSAGQDTGEGTIIDADAGSTGTGSETVDIDYIELRVAYGVPQ